MEYRQNRAIRIAAAIWLVINAVMLLLETLFLGTVISAVGGLDWADLLIFLPFWVIHGSQVWLGLWLCQAKDA